MLILLVYAGSVLVLHYLFVLNRWLGIILSAVLVFYCLAGTTLIREVKQVFLAADRSLEEGRKLVSRIVGRDTSELTDQEVRTAALETLAENLSDGLLLHYSGICFWEFPVCLLIRWLIRLTL